MPLAKCPACGGHVKKLISNTSFVLKGTGWYKTDYASGTGGTAANGKEGNGSKPETKSESKEVKPNGKPGEKLETVSKTE